MSGERPFRSTWPDGPATTTSPIFTAAPFTDTVNRSAAGAFAASPSSACPNSIAIWLPRAFVPARTGAGRMVAWAASEARPTPPSLIAETR